MCKLHNISLMLVEQIAYVSQKVNLAEYKIPFLQNWGQQPRQRELFDYWKSWLLWRTWIIAVCTPKKQHPVCNLSRIDKPWGFPCFLRAVNTPNSVEPVAYVFFTWQVTCTALNMDKCEGTLSYIRDIFDLQADDWNLGKAAVETATLTRYKSPICEPN